jgi:hypothetical protein
MKGKNEVGPLLSSQSKDIAQSLRNIPGGALKTGVLVLGFLLPLVLNEFFDLQARSSLQITECSVNGGNFSLSNCFEYGVVQCLDGRLVL